MSRILTGTARITGTDDEDWPFPDEHVDRNYPISLVVNETQGETNIVIDPAKWGGECRVELDLTATLIAGGDIRMHAVSRLYEGDSEESQDEEDRKDVTFIVPRNHKNNLATTTYAISLRNAGFGGGDHAEIGFGLQNWIVEEA